VAAVGGVIAAIAQAVKELRRPGPAGDRTPARPVTASVTATVPAWPSRAGQPESLASWSLGLGLVALLLANGFVALVGGTTAALDSAPLRTLELGSITLAALAGGLGALSLRKSVASGRGPARPWLVRAGLAASIGALAAVLVAGS